MFEEKLFSSSRFSVSHRKNLKKTVLLKSKRYHLRLKLMKKEFYMIEGNIGIILRTIHFGE